MKGSRFRLRSPDPRKGMLEEHVVTACLDLLRYRGYWPTRAHVAKVKTFDGRILTLGVKGLPDYTMTHGIHRGFLLEFKRPDGELSPNQEQRIAQLRAGYGLRIAVIDSVEALVAWLKEHERSP